jgi:hypothetical protein
VEKRRKGWGCRGDGEALNKSETQSHGREGRRGVRRERWKGKSKGCGSDESEIQSHGGGGSKGCGSDESEIQSHGGGGKGRGCEERKVKGESRGLGAKRARLNLMAGREEMVCEERKGKG